MGDKESFEEISKSEYPMECKKLGRGVFPWNEELWQTYVCAIAKDVIFAKFSKVEELRERLLEISMLSSNFLGIFILIALTALKVFFLKECEVSTQKCTLEL